MLREQIAIGLDVRQKGAAPVCVLKHRRSEVLVWNQVRD